jgi:hypothetical protein
MRIVSLITDPSIVDRVLRHRESERCKVQDPFEPRALPQGVACSPRQIAAPVNNHPVLPIPLSIFPLSTRIEMLIFQMFQ